jgi:3-oxo-4,17-pregnadiene-20-carboxyl-CoA hydratase alpha subunit
MERAELEARLKTYVGTAAGPPTTAPDAVNEAMIRHWCDAMGDRNPVYTDAAAAAKSAHGGIVAPPTMLQAWILRGIAMAAPTDDYDDGQLQIGRLLVAAGYPSVVATNCEQEYTRYLRPGDRVVAETIFESISDQKATGLGTGYFIDTRTTFRDQHGAEVGWMTFRILRFQPNTSTAQENSQSPSTAPAKPRRLRPPLGHDNKWWWDGIAAGELRIQRCKECATLRHPPRPMCGSCQSIEWDWAVSKGAGTVYSYVVMHHPPIPGYDFPLPVALIDLDEGTRLVANVAGCKPSEVKVGMRVQAKIENVDEEMKLPVFYVAK